MRNILALILLMSLTINALAQSNFNKYSLRVQHGNLNEVTALNYDPTTKLLLSSGFENQVVFWDMRTGYEVENFTGALSLIHRTAIDKSSTYVAASSDGQDVMLWDYHTGKKKYTFYDHVTYNNDLDFSPNGYFLASCANDGMYVYKTDNGVIARAFYWDAAGYDHWFAISKEDIYDEDTTFKQPFKSCKFVNNNQIVSIVGDYVVVFNVLDNEMKVLGKHPGAEKVVNNNGKIATISNVNIIFWDINSPIPNSTFSFNGFGFDTTQAVKSIIEEEVRTKKKLMDVNFRVVSMQYAVRSIDSFDRHIQQYCKNIDSLTSAMNEFGKKKIPLDMDNIHDITCWKDQMIVNGYYRGIPSILRVDMTTGRQDLIKVFDVKDSTVHFVQYIDNRTLAYSENDMVKIFDLEFKKEIRNLNGVKSIKMNLGIANSGKWIVSQNNFSRNFELWDVAKCKLEKKMPFVWYLNNWNYKPPMFRKRNGSSFSSYVFMKQKDNVAININNEIRIVSLIDTQTIKTIPHMDDLGFPCEFVKNDSFLIVKGDSTIRIFDVNDPAKFVRMKGSDYNFSKKLLIKRYEDSTSYRQSIINVNTKKEILNIKDRGQGIFTPDGSKYLLLHNFYSLLAFTLYDLKTSKHSQPILVCDISSPRPVFAVSPDSKYLAVSVFSPDILLIDIESAKVIDTIRGHNDAISEMKFSADSRKLYSASFDGTIKTWNIPNGKNAYTLITVNEDDYAIVLGNGYYKTSKGVYSTIHFADKQRHVYSLDNFDLMLNRPDIVLNTIGEGDKQNLLKRARETRVKKYGYIPTNAVDLSDVPVIEILNKDGLIADARNNNTVNVRVRCSAKQSNVQKIAVVVNGVPVTGKDGKVKNVLPGTKDTASYDIQLSGGLNRIQVLCVNAKSVESVKDEVVVNNLNESKPNLHLIVLSAEKYNDPAYVTVSQTNEYSRTVVSSFTNNEKVKKKFASIIVDSFFDGAVTTSTLDKIEGELRNASVNDVVYLYVTGHGALQDSSYYYILTNCGKVLQKDKCISFDVFANFLTQIKPRNKMFILNTCNSGEVYNDAAVFNAMQEEFNDFRKTSGSFVLTSTDAFHKSVSYNLIPDAFRTVAERFPSISVTQYLNYILDYSSENALTPITVSGQIRNVNLDNNFQLW